MSERTESLPSVIRQLQAQFKDLTPSQLHAASEVPLRQCQHLLTGDPTKIKFSAFLRLLQHAGFEYKGLSFSPMTYHDKAIEHQEWEGVRGATPPDGLPQ